MKCLILSAILLIIFLTPAFADEYKDALAAIQSEPKVINAAWGATPASIFVGVHNDGSNRNGYAQYICLLIRQHGVNGSTVIHILDAIQMSNNKKVELGKFICK